VKLDHPGAGGTDNGGYLKKEPKPQKNWQKKERALTCPKENGVKSGLGQLSRKSSGQAHVPNESHMGGGGGENKSQKTSPNQTLQHAKMIKRTSRREKRNNIQTAKNSGAKRKGKSLRPGKNKVD